MRTAVVVRQLQPTEWGTLRDIRLDALRADPAAFESTAEDEVGFDESAWLARLGRRAIGFVDDEPVGLVGWAWGEGTSVVELISMWVQPAQRGTGVADALMEFVKDVVRQMPGLELHLAVRADNDRARRFYERSGFAIGREEASARSGARLIWMRHTE